MADDTEKTEEPTARKIQKARQEGNVPKSIDTSGFVTLLVAVISFIAWTGWIIDRLKRLYIYYEGMIGVEMTSERVMALIIRSIYETFLMVMPIALAVALAGLFAAWGQFGFLFTTKPLVPNFAKLNPITGLKNLISLKKIIEGLKVTIKVSAIFAVAFAVFLRFVQELTSVAGAPLMQQLLWLINRAEVLAAVMLALLLVIAAIDLAFVRYNYFKELRMSKQEIKDEMKQTEGNPEIKAKIRQLQMEMARKRMLSEVPSADVVITNPTHYAVALRYDQGDGSAPKVVAKGADLLALRIREIAREHGVQIVENPPLARELYRSVEVDQEIPEQFYQAVAEVLAFVYRAKNQSL